MLKLECFILVIFIWVSLAEGQECPKNQTYNECGTACPQTCENLYSGPIICTAQCVSGCFCNPGYVLNEKKECILANECPEPECPPTQVFNPCGSACPLTCDNYNTDGPICTLQCVPRCTCPPGQVLNIDTHRCVNPKECPIRNTTCPPGEIYSFCDNPCLPSCEVPDTTNCRFLLCNKGCVCKDGLIRHRATGKCIPKKYCPVSCEDENAVRTKNAPKCPRTCQRKFYGPCSREYTSGCVCKKNYTKDEISGNCVPTKSCPRCGINEVYRECGPKCENTCGRSLAQVLCVEGCRSGCFCRDNWVRNQVTGECVLPDQCPKCGVNETYANQGVDCATCSNYKFVKCAPQNETKCYCLPGYVREDITGKCIMTQDCPQEQCKKKNEEYVQCDPGPCEPTCQHTESQVCPAICKLHGCRCIKGYLRDNATRECVPESQCP